MSGRIVVITGASAGIGKTTAEYFTLKGDKVYCLARRTVEGFNCLSTDVTDKSAVAQAIQTICEAEGRIDVLINNAGYGISGSIEDTELSSAKKLFDVNFFGAVNAIKCVLPEMRAQKDGIIINVSSAAAPLSVPFQAFYSASKAAISSLTEALRIELKPLNIRVTSILPGDVKTDFTAKRVKNENDNPAYAERIARSVAVMEHDEENGYPPELIAREIYRLSLRKNPPVQKVGGFKYSLFVLAAKILPKRLVSFVIGKMYG